MRNGVDAAKALALGSDLAGLAYRFLRAAAVSREQVVEAARRTIDELKITMFCVGASCVGDLPAATLVHERNGDGE